MDTPMIVGREWLIEAEGCAQEALRSREILEAVFSAVISELGLQTIGEAIWHKFPGEGGITGLVALTESHLACHTYPEHGLATFNLYCCKDRPDWDWEGRLAELLGATAVKVNKISRGTENKKQISEQKEFEIEIEMSVTGGDS